MYRIPILIDTDPGVDDFFCLAMAGAFPDRLDLRAVTTVGGNNATAVTTQNALDILHLLQVDVPVAPGAQRFLTHEFSEPVVHAHGHNGMGDIDIPRSPAAPAQETAWECIRRVADECHGELVIVPVGPMTNLAIALLTWPELAGKIKKVVMMGGSTLVGNRMPYGEANASNEPLALRIVLESGIPVDMVGLNATTPCVVKLEEFEAMSVHTAPQIRDAMRQLIRFRSHDAMHDAVAIATLLDEKFVQWLQTDVAVETASPMTAGQTVPVPAGQGHPCRVAVDPDLARYRELFARMCARYKEAVYG